MIQGFVQIVLTLFLVVVSVPILGHYLAEVFFMHKTWLDPVINPLELLVLGTVAEAFQLAIER